MTQEVTLDSHFS